MTATSAGCTSTGQDYQCTSGKKYPQKTIFESLQEAGHEWRYYYNDSSWNYFLEFFLFLLPLLYLLPLTSSRWRCHPV